MDHLNLDMSSYQELTGRLPSEDGRYPDSVAHPSHYAGGCRIEPIDFIEDHQLPFHLGNAVKYIARAGRKDPAKTVEDLQKAMWYIERYIKVLQEKEEG